MECPRTFIKLILKSQLPSRLCSKKFSVLPQHQECLPLNRSRILSQCRHMHVHPPVPNLPNVRFGRFYSKVTLADVDKKLNPTGVDKKKLAKNAPVEKVFLISESEDISEVTLLEAEKISKKKGLQLVKVDDTKGRLHTDKKVYRLMSNAQYFGDDWKSRTKKKDSDAQSSAKDKHKDEKSLVIKSKITQHDLMSKIKNIKKLVDKGHSVRIFIEDVSGSGSNLEAAETVYSAMEEALKESARIVQKRTKGSEIRFQVIPPKVDENAASATSSATAATKDKVVEHADS